MSHLMIIELDEDLLKVGSKALIRFKNEMFIANFEYDGMNPKDFTEKVWTICMTKSQKVISSNLETLCAGYEVKYGILSKDLYEKLYTEVEDTFRRSVEPVFFESMTLLLSTYETSKSLPRDWFDTIKQNWKERKGPRKIISPELAKMIEEMYKSIEKHNDVFPPLPREGEIAIPIGGLAICICSPGCKKELPQPAYRVIGSQEGDERWKF